MKKEEDEQTEYHQEIEISFRLNAEGRTISSTDASPTTINNSNNSIQYEPCSTSIVFNDESPSVINELLLDCEIADCSLLPRTFWIGVNETPQCALEQLALDVFHHHHSIDTILQDSTMAGAEWWVQLRPLSDENTGKYYAQQGVTDKGIPFHWDTDEDLRMMCNDGNTYIHPHVSTVTYLTSLGAPTLVTNTRIHNLSGEYIVPSADTSDCSTPAQTWISWPRQYKHFSFDGRYLHAAPMELMPDGMWEEQQTHTDTENKASVRQHRRVTFLVNIWLHYKPFNVNRFPMPEKMSGYNTEMKSVVTFGPLDNWNNAIQHNERDATRFTWPIGGDGDEVIHMALPLHAIHKEAFTGGSLHINYQDSQSVTLEKTIGKNSNDDDDQEETIILPPSAKRTKGNDAVVDVEENSFIEGAP